MNLKPHHILFLLASAAGLIFASVSTFDFVQHLDRQVHDLHCSFVPGLVDASGGAESGCYVTLMSPYSSALRRSLWGGLPISLPAIAVFAFLLFRGVDILARPARERRAASLVLLFAACLPLAASLVMGSISFLELGTACKLCVGIYCSSIVAFGSAAWGMRAPRDGWPAEQPGTVPRIGGVAAAQLAGFVLLPVLAYVATMPNYDEYMGKCGELKKTKDPYGILVPLDKNDGAAEAIEVFDPLCPACRGFEERLAASGLEERLHRKGLLFPLDDTCNWMVTHALHPGACTVSEAVLCAGTEAQIGVNDVIAWSFENQEAIREAAADDPEAAGKMVLKKFPALKGCLGSAGVKSKLNKSLRWAVSNELSVLTPQLYVNGQKLCDEDTDLGMEYALSRMLEAQGVK